MRHLAIGDELHNKPTTFFLSTRQKQFVLLRCERNLEMHVETLSGVSRQHNLPGKHISPKKYIQLDFLRVFTRPDLTLQRIVMSEMLIKMRLLTSKFSTP